MAETTESDVRTIQIYGEVHPKLKARAEKESKSLVDYSSKIIAECIARLEFLERIAPGMQLLKSQPDKLNIADIKAGKIVSVGIKEGRIYCETCETDNCKHIHYAMIYPDLKELAEKVNEL